MDLELDGKRAIVTGGTGDIGRAVARQLGLEGVRVAIVGRTPSTVEQAVAELRRDTGADIVGAVADVGEDDQVRTMVATVVHRLGGVDILVNSVARRGGQDATADEFLAGFNVKVMGYLRCAREVAPHMRAHGWGRIVNIGGLAARLSGELGAGMRNLAVAALTKNLSDELGKDGISVTAVHPGLVWTSDAPEQIATTARAFGIGAEEARDRLAGSNPLNQVITPEQVADVVTFLASPRAIAINGDAVAVGGGAGRTICT